MFEPLTFKYHSSNATVNTTFQQAYLKPLPFYFLGTSDRIREDALLPILGVIRQLRDHMRYTYIRAVREVYNAVILRFKNIKQ